MAGTPISSSSSVVGGGRRDGNNSTNNENAVPPSYHELVTENERLRQDLEEYKAQVAILLSKNNGKMPQHENTPPGFQISLSTGGNHGDCKTDYVAFDSDNAPVGEDSKSPRDGLTIQNSMDGEGDGIQRTSKRTFEEDEDFFKSLADRAGWLVGLLVLQSMSSFIIAQNEELLQNHTVIVQFLTMLVGAGGNAGNQASVRVIRGLAIGSINSSTTKPFLRRELATGLWISVILGLAGFLRALVFFIPWPETIAITTSLFVIVASSVVIGLLMPLCMKAVGIDPAHSSTTIQVVMDILGVLLTVHISGWLLDSVFQDWQ